MLGIFFLAISTGLPIALGVETFKVWMWEEGSSLQMVTLLNITTLPYIAKVFLGPMVDQYQIPILHRWLGRRRSWSIVSQLIIFFGFILLSLTFTVRHVEFAIALLLCISLASAFNHTALNAYRVEVMPTELTGIAAVVGALGYRLGKLIAGAGALLMAAVLGWNVTYLLMPLVLIITMITTLLVDEPSLRGEPVPIQKETLKSWFRARLLRPIRDFIKKHPQDWQVISVFVLLFGVGDFLVEGISTIFYLDIGFSKIEVANIAKAFGLICTILGGIVGGHLVVVFGVSRMVYISTIAHCISYVSLIVLAQVGDSLPWLYASVVAEFLTEGIKTSALVAYVSLLCGKTYYTASQYALFSSMKVVLRPILGAWAGLLAASLGWSTFFSLSMILSLLPLLAYYYINSRAETYGKAV